MTKMENMGIVPHLVHEMHLTLLKNGSDPNVTTATTISTTTTQDANVTDVPILTIPPCQWLLYAEIANSRVHIWDLIILIPNVLFLFFLILKARTATGKLRNTSSPIFLAFYGLVWIVAVISVLRSIVAMTVNATVEAGDITDKLLWLILRFFLLATELSVVTFGLAFGHLESKTSIKRVLLVTSSVALIYSIAQGYLEFKYPDDRFHVSDKDYDIFAHGGMLFWLASSIFFFVNYTIIVILPWTRLRHRFALPTKKTFYFYSFFLALLNLTQAIGSALLYREVQEGMCIVDVTTYIYFTCFAPLVYITFLREYLKTTQPPSILFSYKAQEDEVQDDDFVSLPQQNYPVEKLEDVAANSYDSTHFDLTSPNPLYQPIAGGPSINADHYSRSPDVYNPVT